MKKILLLLIGLLLIAILTYFCFIGKVDGIKEDLVSKTEAIYKDKNINWVKVMTAGSGLKSTRDIVLKGVAPSLEMKNHAGELAKDLYGITKVDNQLVVQVPKVVAPSPYEIAVTKDRNNKIVLNGYVANATEHKLITNEAIKLFGQGNVTDNLKEVKGSPSMWAESTILSLNKLQPLEYGEFYIKDKNLVFKGHAPKQEIKDNLIASMSAKLSSNYTDNYLISAPKVVPIESAQYCEDNFRKLLSTQKINFKYNKAIVSKKSYALLDKIVNIAKECPNSLITIEGHTDSDGSRTYNKKLSNKRANAVKSYLIKHGIVPNRLSAVGYGELRPIASNQTENGKAKNRRIELKVKGAK